MKVQLLIAAMALGVCVSLPVKREQRKFVYQDGYPSVRRYPVFPDRVSKFGHVLNNTLDENDLGLLNELLPNPTPTKRPGFTQPEEVEPEVEGTSTNPSPSAEPESTTTTSRPILTTQEARPILTTQEARPILTTQEARPILTTQEASSVFEEELAPLEGASSTLGGGFSFTPKPSSVVPDLTGPVRSIFQTDPVTPDSVFPSGTPEVSSSVFPSDPVSSDSTFSSSSSFGVFTEAPEDSTDVSLTTEMISNDVTDEENLSNSTQSPLEEVFNSLSNETTTDAPLLDQTATESGWDPVTQDISPTEEIEPF